MAIRKKKRSSRRRPGRTGKDAGLVESRYDTTQAGAHNTSEGASDRPRVTAHGAP